MLMAWAGTAGRILITAVIAAGLAGAGWRMLRWVRVPLTGVAAAFITGFAGSALAGLGIGACGLFYPAVSVATAIVLAAAGVPVIRRMRRRRRQARPSPDESWFRLGAVGVGVIAAPFSLAPPVWCDTLSSTLAAPVFFRHWHRAADMPHISLRFPLLTEHALTLLGSVADPRLLNLAAGGAIAGLLFSWAGARFGRTAGWLAALGWAASDHAVALIANVKPDLAAESFALLALAAWDRIRAAPRLPRASSLLCGIALGWTLAAKYTTAAAMVGLPVFLIVRRAPRIRRLKELAWVGTGLVLGGGPFLIRTWLITGNPVYPFFFAGLDWVPECRAALVAYGCPGYDADWHSLASIAGAVLRLLGSDGGLALAGLPLLLLFSAPAGTGTLVLAGACGVAFLMTTLPCLRYMSPALLPVTVAGAAALAASPLFSGRARGGRVLILGILLLGVLRAFVVADFTFDRLPTAAGLERPAAFETRILSTYAGAAAAVPGTGRLLLLGDPRGMLFGRNRPAVTQDLMDLPVPLKIARECGSPERIAVRFRQLGFHTIAVNYVTSEFRGSIVPAFSWRNDEIGRYARFWARWAEPVWPAGAFDYDYRNGGFAAWRLRRHPRPERDVTFLPGTEALAARRDGDDEAAQRDRLDALVVIAPSVAFFHLRRGLLLVQSGRWAEGRDELTRGLRAGFRPKGALQALARARLALTPR